MNAPSIRTLLAAFPHLTSAQAREIRAIIKGPSRAYVAPLDALLTRLQRIDRILGTFGVELIPAGRNVKSPAILFCNAGDPYATTILAVNGRFRIGNWGDIVERGNYE